MAQLCDLRLLKSEEKVLVEMINLFKTQLNRLKIEELILAGKIKSRESNSSSGADQGKVEYDDHYEAAEDVNKTDLNLETARHILAQLSRGGAFFTEAECEDESEMED